MRKGDVPFLLLKYGALSLLGSLFWELTGLKWPDKSGASPEKTKEQPTPSG
jgi:hypothetical protein